jgi:hypothetical protein
MAKELPYFKFEPSQWENGNIQICSFEAQGVFINLCSMYWQRLGDLPYKLAVQKICKGNATALDSLIEDQIIKVIDGSICIDFLNEQLSEFENLSNTNSKNALVGWEKRKKDATAKQSQSERNAIRGEKIREDKIKVDESETLTLGFGDLFFSVTSKYINGKKYIVRGVAGLREYMELNNSILDQPERHEAFLKSINGDVFNEFMHVKNKYKHFLTNKNGNGNNFKGSTVSQFSGDYSEPL